MRKTVYILSFISAFIFLLKETVEAQSLPVGTPVLEYYYRRQQLLGNFDAGTSFTLRPVFPTNSFKVHDAFDPDTSLKSDNLTYMGPVSFANGAGKFQVLPFSQVQQFNSHNPYGWNDGPMIPAKGYQTMATGGFFLKYGPLSVQLMPQFVYAANPSFTGFATGHNDADLTAYYSGHVCIDMPERFGTTSYSKLFWGQSRIALTFKPISIGLSTENVWWGPGIRNSLILSNNAPGCRHLTLNSVEPFFLFVGLFEFQALVAHLDESPYQSLTVTSTSTGKSLTPKKNHDWRYYAAFNLNYMPKWIEGLTLGLTRSFDAYHKDVNTFSEYLPFFVPYQKQNTNDGDPIPRDQETSLYARWLFNKAHAEVYFEYGLNDNSYNFRDFIGSPGHSRAYVFGVRKLVPLSSHADQQILIGAEVTQLSQTVDRLVRSAYSWYGHSEVKQGMTEMGQVLGAGTGPGGNLQSMELSWVSGLKKIGIRFERYEHDVDFYQRYFPDINGNSRNWVDLAVALQGDWTYKNLIFNATLEGVKSLNYEWVLKDYNPSEYYIPHNDSFNLHALIGGTYRF